MPLDGYFLEKLNHEINEAISGHFLRKIKMPNARSFLFEFYKSKPVYLLIDLSSNSPHLRLADDFENSEDNPFLKSMKRLLLNAKLTKVSQVKKDRILKFLFISSDPFLGEIKRELILEIMGRNSNLILTEKNIIIDAYLKRFSETNRSILPKLSYEPFPTNKGIFNYEDIHTYTSAKDLFNQCMGFSMELATFVYEQQLDIDNEPTKPTLYENGFHAFDFNRENQKHFESLSELLSVVYKPKEAVSPLYKQLEKEYKKRIDRIKHFKQELETNQDFDQYKQIADQIYSSGLDLGAHHSEYLGYSLDYRKTLNENAQRLYKIYKKKKDSLEHLSTQILKSEDELTYYKDLLDNFDNLDLSELKDELKPPKKAKPKQHYTFVGENFKIHVGKSSRQNEYLTHHFSKPDDLWFHVKDYSGAHVILQGDVNETSIRKAAQLAAIHSPQKLSSSVEVIYTKTRFVKKIKGRPGFYVTFKHEKSIFIDP